MNETEALIVTKDEGLVHEVERLLAGQGLRVHVSEDWKQPFTERGKYAYYLVDDRTVKKVDDVNVPSASWLIVLIGQRSFDRVRDWLKQGAHDVLVIPDELEKLNALAQRMAVRAPIDETAAAQRNALDAGGRVRAFYSVKGGSGKTVISAMVAQSLQLQFGKRVMLIDFNAQFGGLEVILGLESPRSYLDLQPVLQELSFNHIQNVAVKEETTGIHVLLSPLNPEQAESISDELVTRVLQTCKAHFDEVILDLPSTLNTVSFTALTGADDIYYVVTPDSMAVRGLKHALDLFRRFQIGNHGNVHLIVNRNNKKSELSEKDLTQLVDLPLIGSVRADYYGIQPFVNMGRPFYSKKGDKGSSKVAQDVRLLVEKALLKGV
ncbi:MAG: AAA family ATPase [Novibacillus thermophilus]|uniref:AAA domain-containing protein n=1 Tax=Novibacillus thermophilus TaxID=1471761 RepID=A0A1U9K380_9BACL|nr:AAA family ATPase [Novibacillus thermophilus]AQS54490.1 hypothetical protein B0W44_00435 [Novibacillus thermophilus]